MHIWSTGLPHGSSGKDTACNPGDAGSIPGSGKSSEEEMATHCSISCLENPTDRAAWWSTFHGVAKSQT